MRCEGTTPDWRLAILGAEARLYYPSETQMEIPHSTRAEGREWPQALSLIGARDTAIVILNQRDCTIAADTFAFEAQILTQRGQTPILLSGCCAVTE